MSEKLCPYCTNGTTINKVPLYEDESGSIYLTRTERKENAYLENTSQITRLDTFYYCPFCGRELKGKNLDRRQFRGD